MPSVRHLRAIIKPDSDDTVVAGQLDDGPDATYDRIELTYHANGALHTRKDQRGTVLTFTYTDQNQLQAQQATTLGGDTDDAVRALIRAYDELGQLVKLTSHGNLTDHPEDTADVLLTARTSSTSLRQ